MYKYCPMVVIRIYTYICSYLHVFQVLATSRGALVIPIHTHTMSHHHLMVAWAYMFTCKLLLRATGWGNCIPPSSCPWQHGTHVHTPVSLYHTIASCAHGSQLSCALMPLHIDMGMPVHTHAVSHLHHVMVWVCLFSCIPCTSTIPW